MKTFTQKEIIKKLIQTIRISIKFYEEDNDTQAIKEALELGYNLAKFDIITYEKAILLSDIIMNMTFYKKGV